MEIITLRDGQKFASNCYILLSDKFLSVVDPSVSYDEALKRYPKLIGKYPQFVLLTHAHIDHMWEINTYVDKGFEVLVSKDDAKMLSDRSFNCALMLNGQIDSYNGKYSILEDGDKLDVCDTVLEVIATPGHTKGSVCYLSDGIIFTGDTLFAGGSYGRFDLPTGSAAELSNSLNKLFSLPEELLIYPGHGDISTLKSTKAYF